MEIKYLPTCECGVPDGYGDVENCGSASIAWIKFSDGDALYVCEKHLEEIEEGSEK